MSADRLAPLFERFQLQAHVFHSGALCGTTRFDSLGGVGHLHVLRAGRMRMDDGTGRSTLYTAPCLAFFPRPTPHWIDASPEDGAELLCASVVFGDGATNPLLRSLPDVLAVGLHEIQGLDALLGLLFEEGFHQRCGRQAALDRLSELLILQLLRHCMATGAIRGGLFAGLADPRLAKALNAIHAAPGDPWTLPRMAHVAGMSRARFAAHFHQVLGITPGDYLTDWRLSVAKTLLLQGRPVKTVALDVGYASASALARAFASRHEGRSPTEWLARRSEHQAHS